MVVNENLQQVLKGTAEYRQRHANMLQVASFTKKNISPSK